MKKLMNSKLLIIFIIALLFRLIIATTAYHGDSIDYLNWGINLQEYGFDGFYFRDTPDAGFPNYPPGFYYILTANQYFYDLVSNIVWQANVNISFFPSNVATWFLGDAGRIYVNKVPAILADLGVAFFIYLIARKFTNKKKALIVPTAFLFSPPIWYNSAVWGQTESLVALPLIAAFWCVVVKKYTLGGILIMASLIIKPLGVLVTPVYAVWWLRKISIRQGIGAMILIILIFVVLHIPFHTQDPIPWIYKLYRDDVKEVSGYLVANAYNIWSFAYGFKPISDTIKVFGIQAFYVGIAIFISITAYLVSEIKSKTRIENVLYIATLVSFAGFLFMTRIHERYFYLTLLFLAPLIGKDKRIWISFWILSVVHLINLYHYWWVPRIDILVKILESTFADKLIVIVNIIMFLYLFWLFGLDYKRKAED